MDKNLLLEKLLPFCNNERVKDLILILNERDEREIIRNLELFNEIFIIKLVLKDSREIRLNYCDIVKVEEYRTEDPNVINKIFTVRNSSYVDGVPYEGILAKDIQHLDIDPNSCSLFASKEEMLSKCDLKLIKEDAVEQLWQYYFEKFPMKYFFQYWKVFINPPVIQDILSKLTIEELSNNEDICFKTKNNLGIPVVLTYTKYENMILLRPLYKYDISSIVLSRELSIVGSLPEEYMFKLFFERNII